MMFPALAKLPDMRPLKIAYSMIMMDYSGILANFNSMKRIGKKSCL